MFVGAGLTFAGLTNICGMAFVLARMPWNRPLGGSPKSGPPAEADCCRNLPAG
jgi:hypothetical protein